MDLIFPPSRESDFSVAVTPSVPDGSDPVISNVTVQSTGAGHAGL
jgi:hypothetical protein